MGRTPALLTTLGMVTVMVAGCTYTIDFNGVRGEGPLVRESRQAGSFNAIDVGGGIHLRMRIGPSISVELEAEQNILDILTVTVIDGTLTVETDDSYSSPRGVTLTVVAPEITGIALSGGADGRLQDLDADDLTVDVSGGADLEVAGRIGHLDVTASGGGKARLGDLEAEAVQLDASGGASVEVRASQRIEGRAAGGASVRTAGDATVDVSTSGGASVS